MEKTNNSSLVTILENLWESFSRIFFDIGKLAKAEAALAKQSMVSLIILGIVMLMLIFSLWFCFLTLFVALLLYCDISLLLAVALAALLNVLTIGVVSFWMSRLRKNLSFRATRHQLNHLTDAVKESFHGNT